MALLQAASSPALSVCGPGVAKDRLPKKRKEKISMDSSASEDIDQTFDERLWRKLPEEVFDLIVERLPFAAQCRARCLGHKWKRLHSLSLPPPCMIVSKLGDQNARFYCDSGRKWYDLPSNRHAPPLGGTWEVVDADAGLVCYQCNVDGWFWLWVCNPLKPGCLSRLIRPESRSPRIVIRVPKIKLIGCRANNTFKIVAVVDKVVPVVYDSTTSQWQVFEYNYSLLDCDSELFLWGNKTYAYDTQKNLKQTPDRRLMTAFNIKTGEEEWTYTNAEIPSEIRFPTKRFFLGNNHQVILVLFSYRKQPRPYFSVWKLLDEGSRFADDSFTKLKNWEKVEMGSERAIVDLRGHRLVCASYGAEDVWFTFRDENINEDGSRAHKCIRHSFASNCWSVVQCPGDWGEGFRLYNWEPSLDIDPR